MSVVSRPRNGHRPGRVLQADAKSLKHLPQVRLAVLASIRHIRHVGARGLAQASRYHSPIAQGTRCVSLRRVRRSGAGTGGRRRHDDHTRASRPRYLIRGCVLHLSSVRSRHQAGRSGIIGRQCVRGASRQLTNSGARVLLRRSPGGPGGHHVRAPGHPRRRSRSPYRAALGANCGPFRTVPRAERQPCRIYTGRHTRRSGPTPRILAPLRQKPPRHAGCVLRDRGVDNHEEGMYLREPVSAPIRRSRLRGMWASMLSGVRRCHRIGCVLCPLR
jgi:hypothetical protein